MASLAVRTSGSISGRRRYRPGLIDLYLVRGALGPFLFVTLFLVAAMMLERSLRLIQQMAATGADVAFLPQLLAQLAPYYVDLALPAGFMVAAVLLVARLDDRLELEAMLSFGLSLSRIATPLVALGVGIGLVSLYVGGWLEPEGRWGFRTTRLEAVNAGRLAQLDPRAIYQPAQSLALTYDSRSPAGPVRGLFVWQRLPDGRTLVLTSRSGEIGFVSRRRSVGIALADGLYLSEPAGEAHAPTRVVFDRMLVRSSLRLEDAGWARGADQKEMNLAELIAARRSGVSPVPDHALATELYSRLARALSLPLIPLLVLPLAFATKRGRRGTGILAGGVVLMVFHHALNLVKQLAYGGEVPPGLAIFGLVGIFALLVLALFAAGRHLPSHSPMASALKFAGGMVPRRGPRQGRRLPTLSGRTLASYLAGELARWTLLALLAIVVLLQMVDLFDRGEEFVGRGMGASDVVYYLWLRLAPTVQQALPIAALAGAMVTFAGLGRTLEMTAIRGVGISQWRILLMALPIPLALSAASWFLSEQASPRSLLRFSTWWAATEPAAPAAEPPSRWFRIGNEIVRAARQGGEGRRLDDVEIFRRDGAGILRERVSAASASLADGQWMLSDVRTLRLGAGPIETEAHARVAWPTPLRPDDVTAFFTSAPALSSSAARRALDIAAPVSRGEALFSTRLYRAAAEPLAPLVMLLLALPLAFASPRTGVSWPALLYAGGGGLLYIVADGVLTVAGQVGYLPAAVGAWAAPVMVALAAVTVLLYAER